jgi:hypothetical protein
LQKMQCSRKKKLFELEPHNVVVNIEWVVFLVRSNQGCIGLGILKKVNRQIGGNNAREKN